MMSSARSPRQASKRSVSPQTRRAPNVPLPAPPQPNPRSPSPGPRPKPNPRSSSPKTSPRALPSPPPCRAKSPQVPPRRAEGGASPKRPPLDLSTVPSPTNSPQSSPPSSFVPLSGAGPRPPPNKGTFQGFKYVAQNKSDTDLRSSSQRSFGTAALKHPKQNPNGQPKGQPQVSGGALHGSRGDSLLSFPTPDSSDGDSDSDGEDGSEMKAEADAIALFNESPNKGIKLLNELDLVKETPESVASYLQECRELDKKAIGDYLGERNQFALKVLQLYIKMMDFSRDSFEKALRKLLSGFRLPGESQKIERIMEIFAEIFSSQQTSQGPFKSSDAVFVLAYSTIMLNTDLHNPQVKRKMTLEQFVSNNRGINQGEDLPEALLTDLYQNIRETEIRMEGSGPFPTALKKGPITVETKQLYLGKHKKIRNRRHIILDADLTLYIFKSVKDEGGSPVAELSLKDGLTIYRREVEEGEKRKEEKAFTLYLTLTPEDTTDAVVNSGWRFILPSAKAFQEWASLFEAHTLCLLTFSPPVVGVPINDELIAHLNRRVRDTAAQILFLQRNLAETCKQVEALSKETQGTCSQLRDLKRRALTLNPNSAMGGCLSVAIKMLEEVAQLSSSLEISLQEGVCQPLLDLSHTEICAAKDHVGSFVNTLNTQCEVADKLKKEIHSQSAQTKGDRTKTQKLFAESQRLDNKVEASRLGVRESLHDITCGCDRQIVASFHQMILSYHNFYQDGAARFSEIWKEAQQKQREYEAEKPQQLPIIQASPSRPSSLTESPTMSSTSNPPPSLGSSSEDQNVQFKMDFSAVKTGTLSKKKKKKGNWKKYYFTLKRKYLYYFARFSHNLEYKGVIMLKNCSVIPLESSSRFPFVICTQINTHYFLVSSSEERSEWIEAIEKCTKNDEGFKKRDTLDEELDEMAESFKRQNEIVTDKKKVLKTNLLFVGGSHDSCSDETFLDGSDIIKQGFLQKRGDKIKSWTQRWFALKQNRVDYYEVLPFGELKSRGTIHLLNAVVKHSERELKAYCFEIHHEYRTFYIAAKDEAEESSWIEAILRSTTKLGDNESTWDSPLSTSVSPKPDRRALPRMNTQKVLGGSGYEKSGCGQSFTGTSSEGFVLEGKILKTGYLIKKGGMRKNWTTRYFELRPDCLTYYRSPGETPKGNIILEPGCTVNKLHERKPYSFSIAQETMGVREYWLAASDGKEEEEWVYAIEQCIFELRSDDLGRKSLSFSSRG